MLTRNQPDLSGNITVISIEDLVPKNHLIRKIKKSIDFSFIYDIVEDLYSDSTGRPYIDPVVLFKIVFIQYLFNIRSMRRTIEDIEVNAAYRWFLGFDFNSEVPHFSTFSKNYERRFKDSNVFKEVFNSIVAQAFMRNLIEPDNLFVDSTHVKAYANKRRVVEVVASASTTKYIDALHDEINTVRLLEEKPSIDFDEPKKVVKSLTDPDCGMFHKGEKERQLAYSNQVISDENGWVLESQVYPGNLHDGITGQDMILPYLDNNKDVKVVVVDSGYNNPILLREIFNRQVLPIIPYQRPKGPRSTNIDAFTKKQFQFIENENYYLCPNHKILSYRGVSKDGYFTYRSKTKDCRNCPFLNRCTNQKVKVITRHPYENSTEYANQIRLTPLAKQIYPKRKSSIERVFGLSKMNHCLGVTYLRGLKKNEDRSFIIFASHNMAKLARLIAE